MTRGHLLYIFDHLDWKSRMPVALAAKKAGYNVTIGIVGVDEGDQIDGLDGFQVLSLRKPANHFGLLSAFVSLWDIRKTIHQCRPDLIHTVTLKYSFLVGLACTGLRRLRVLYTIAGLGFLFRTSGVRSTLIRWALSPLLKLVLKNRHADLIFQNPDDRDLLVNMGYVRHEQTHLVISSGVDLDKFSPVPEPENQEPIAMMPTRLVHEKGVAIFVAAARKLNAKGIKARYQIVGGLTTHNPRAITEAEMKAYTEDGVVEWLGRVQDMPAILSTAAVIVYPSYYGEGVPRVTIEACAAGRPVITTDHPGCREVVPNGDNGYLVPVKDVDATAEAMERLLTDRDLRKQMGKASRALAEMTFDIKSIVAQTVGLYAHILHK